ncbi:hypothetical protein BGX38DRAFT_1279811 [Terfezia claveryi]|nr:hypothetical protein BGX38DRAFT_1279811 [Terfezia claveryi]
MEDVIEAITEVISGNLNYEDNEGVYIAKSYYRGYHRGRVKWNDIESKVERLTKFVFKIYNAQKKSKTTGKAPTSSAPESTMQKKKSTREGPASSAGKRPKLIEKEGMITHKALAVQTTEHVPKKGRQEQNYHP